MRRAAAVLWGWIGLVTVACSADLDTLDGGTRDTGIADVPEKVCGVMDDIARWPGDLEGCTVYRGSIIVDGIVDGLPDLASLHALREVDGNVSFRMCFDLASLRGLERLERAGGFGLSEVPLIEDLQPLGSVRHVGGVVLDIMDGLVSLRGLERLESVERGLTLSRLKKLESVDGLQGLRSVGRLTITANGALRSLAGLSALERVDGDLIIQLNPNLPQSEISAFLSRIEVTGGVRVEGNGP